MSNLLARFLTAGLVVPFLLVAIWWHNPIGWWGVVFVATGLGLREFFNMTMAKEPVAERGFGVLLGLVFAGALYWDDLSGVALSLALATITIAAFFFYLFRYREIESVAPRVSAMLAGILYVSLLTFAALLKKLPSGGAWVIIVLSSTWFSDTSAYFAGRFLGPFWPAKFAAVVSPKKTIIGAIGGLAGSIGALTLAKLWYLPSLTWIDVFLVAIPANVLGQLGDLCESLLKRSTGVKDSGRLLPGHGGMLDRVDAVMFAAPWVYAYARLFAGKL